MVSSRYPVVGGGVPAALGAGLPLPPPVNGEAPQQEESTETLTADFFHRLRASIDMAEKDLRPYREGFLRRVQLYAGHSHGSNNENVDTPFNCYSLAFRIYQRRLVSGDPRVMVRSRSPDALPDAHELSLACEQLFREINLQGTIKEVVLQALLGVGIVKVATTPRELDESMGFLHDAEQPFCDPVLMENFAYDTNAKRWEEIDWCGDRYRMPLKDLRDNPLFNQAGVQAIGQPQTRQDENLQNDEDSVQHMGAERAGFRDELRSYVTLWDIWLPREKVLVTLPEGQGDPLRTQAWDGPEMGPYHLLCFDPIPGNIMPVAPGGHLESMARLLNNSIRKLGDQLDRQKSNTLITIRGENAGDGTTLQNAKDGDVLAVDDPKNTTDIRTGGIDQQSYAAVQGFREMFSWLGGNIDTIGGLSTQSDTLGQERLLAEGGNSLISELEAKTMDFLKDVCTDLAWYVYSDPMGTRQLVKKLKGTRFQTPVNWGPERRSRDFFLFEFEVDPFSVHARSPSERLQLLMQLMPMSLQMGQFQQILQQSGGQLDVEAMWRLFTRYSGLTEFSELLTFNGVPVTAEPKSDRMPSANTPGIPHEYIRRNVGSGGGGQQPQQQAMAQMMAAGNNNDGGNQ